MRFSWRFFLVSAQLLAAANVAFGGASSGATAAAAGDAAFADRRASLMRMGDPRFMRRNIARLKSYDILAATALKGCGPAEWPEYMAGLSWLEEGGDEPIEMFSLPPLVRYLYQFGHCMSAAQKEKLLKGLSKPQNLLGHGTLNHAIVRATSWYLLAQHFPQAKWTDWKSRQAYSSVQLMAKLKPLLVSRAFRVYQSGHQEWLSPTYAMTNIYPLVNLIDFAADGEVRKLAEDEATLEIAVLRAHSFHGVIVPPLTRKTVEQLNATDSPQDYVPSITQHVLWYYYGEPSGLSAYDFQRDAVPLTLAMLGLSDWAPAKSVLALNRPPGHPYAIKMVTPEFSMWGDAAAPEIYGDSYISDDFAIGTGNLLFQPDGYSGHIQTFAILLKSNQPRNQIECYHPYWNSSQGEDAWGADRSSPFQQMHRYDDSSIVMLFDIPNADPWVLPDQNRFWASRSKHKDGLIRTVTCRIPRSMDEIITEPDWVFVRHGEIFVAMATLKGRNEYDNATVALAKKYRIVKVREAKTALFFRVERARPDLSFAQFRETVRTQQPEYDSASSSVLITERSGIKTRVRFNLQAEPGSKRWSAIPTLTRNGKALPRNETAAVESAVLTLKNGTLEVNADESQVKISRP